MVRGKGTKGRGARGGSTTRSGASRDQDDLLARGAIEKDLPSTKRDKEDEGAGVDGTQAKRKKQDEKDDEDWGLEGKSFWKGTVPQSVDTNCYVMNQIPPQLKQNLWSGAYCDLTLFLPKLNEALSGEMWTMQEEGFNKKIVRQKITSIMEWVKCFHKYMQAMAIMHCQDLTNMISYASIIIRAAETNQGLSWLFYDEQFRLKMATNPDMEWGKIDNHLWTYCITNFAVNKHETESAPAPSKVATTPKPQPQNTYQRGRGGHFRPYNRGRGRGGSYQNNQGHQGYQGNQGYQGQSSENSAQTTPGKSLKACFHYNRGRCERTRCSWPHICSGCGKTHPRSACPDK